MRRQRKLKMVDSPEGSFLSTVEKENRRLTRELLEEARRTGRDRVDMGRIRSALGGMVMGCFGAEMGALVTGSPTLTTLMGLALVGVSGDSRYRFWRQPGAVVTTAEGFQLQPLVAKKGGKYAGKGDVVVAIHPPTIREGETERFSQAGLPDAMRLALDAGADHVLLPGEVYDDGTPTDDYRAVVESIKGYPVKADAMRGQGVVLDGPGAQAFLARTTPGEVHEVVDARRVVESLSDWVVTRVDEDGVPDYWCDPVVAFTHGGTYGLVNKTTGRVVTTAPLSTLRRDYPEEWRHVGREEVVTDEQAGGEVEKGDIEPARHLVAATGAGVMDMVRAARGPAIVLLGAAAVAAFYTPNSTPVPQEAGGGSPLHVTPHGLYAGGYYAGEGFTGLDGTTVQPVDNVPHEYRPFSYSRLLDAEVPSIAVEQIVWPGADKTIPLQVRLGTQPAAIRLQDGTGQEVAFEARVRDDGFYSVTVQRDGSEPLYIRYTLVRGGEGIAPLQPLTVTGLQPPQMATMGDRADNMADHLRAGLKYDNTPRLDKVISGADATNYVERVKEGGVADCQAANTALALEMAGSRHPQPAAELVTGYLADGHIEQYIGMGHMWLMTAPEPEESSNVLDATPDIEAGKTAADVGLPSEQESRLAWQQAVGVPGKYAAAKGAQIRQENRMRTVRGGLIGLGVLAGGLVLLKRRRQVQSVVNRVRTRVERAVVPPRISEDFVRSLVAAEVYGMPVGEAVVTPESPSKLREKIAGFAAVTDASIPEEGLWAVARGRSNVAKAAFAGQKASYRAAQRQARLMLRARRANM